MDIGTTATAALATVGASVNARRTGFAHVFFNLLTGAGAFFILPLYVGGLRRLAPQWTAANPELALVGFHTAFNLLGVAMMLPYANAFSRVIERLIPQNNELLFRLEPTLLGQPRLALANVRLTLEHIAARCAEVCRKLLTVNQLDAVMGELIACQTALDETRLYLERIPRSSVEMDTWSSHVNCLHVVDHLGRLLARVQKANRVHAVRSSEGLKKPREELARILGMDWRAAEDLAKLAEALKSYSTSLDDKVSAYRRRTVEQAALGKVPLDDAWSLLDGYRWLRRVSFHFYRILEHLRAADSGQVAPLPPGNGMAEESPDAD
jgi:phosphate:Na+ symporter